MAALSSEAPDPKTFQSWEDAFKYPVPSVRRLEQQLRSDISGNRERLRTLVGTSYRELLGTAGTIIHMDKQMKDAEEYLSTIGQKCSTRLLDKSKANTTRIARSKILHDEENYAHASHVAVLQNCPRILVILIKSGKSLQLAAKVLVLARLLYKKASEYPSSASFVHNLWSKISKLRLKLLNVTDKRLADPTLDPEAILDAMCAYSLATNSSCADILRHFHHTRLNAISTDKDAAALDQRALTGLQIWTKTMSDTQSLFPRQIGSALMKIKDHPLLQLEEVVKLYELELDIHGRFLDDSIRHFTPYIRHDDLNITAAAQQLSAWSPTALQAYVESLTRILADIQDFQTIIDIRRECLHLWLSSKGRMIGTNKNEGLDLLRQVFQDRLLQCIDEQARRIAGVVDVVTKSLITVSHTSNVGKGLWANDLVKVDHINQTKKFTDAVRRRVHGTGDKHTDVLKTYSEWVTNMNSVRTAISDLKAKKWSVEDFDIEEEEIEDIEDMKHRLEQEDCSQLEEKHQISLATAFELLHHSLDRQQFDTNSEDENDSAAKAIFMIRVLRAIKQETPEGWRPQDITFKFVSKLHRLISQPVINAIMSTHHQAISKATQEINTPVRLLWDGTPELPVVPSPWPFRLLKALHLAMADRGPDIWTKSAVACLQQLLRTSLVAAVRQYQLQNGHDREASKATTNGDSQAPFDKATLEKDAKIQLIFDILYLRAAMTTQLGEGNDEILDYCNSAMEEIKLAQDLYARIKSSANQYWTRTSLLFALLA